LKIKRQWTEASKVRLARQRVSGGFRGERAGKRRGRSSSTKASSPLLRGHAKLPGGDKADGEGDGRQIRKRLQKFEEEAERYQGGKEESVGCKVKL